MAKGRCAVSGGSGYVGSRISEHLRRKGWLIRELGRDRRTPEKSDVEYVRYRLEGGLDPDVLRGTDVLIHAAYDFRVRTWDEIFSVNVLGSARLFEAATTAGVKRIIHISTMSAFPGCPSLYGKAKLEVEKRAAAVGATVVRPGLVYGRNAGGMVGGLKRVVEGRRVVPLIGDGRQTLYLAHEEDLAELIARLSVEERIEIRSPIIAACEKGKTFREILDTLAAMHGKRVVFLPLPWRLVWAGLKLCEVLDVETGFRSDSVVSIVNQDRKPGFDTRHHLGVVFREFSAHTMPS